MKNAFRKLFNTIAIATLLLLTFAVTPTQAQVERSKKIERTFSGKTNVMVEHRRGTLRIKQSSDGNVTLKASCTVQGKSEEDITTVLEHFDIDIQEAGSDLSLRTHLETKNWMTVNNRSRITFQDATTVNGIRDVNIEFTLYVPQLNQLALSNKYDDIVLENSFRGMTRINLHSGELRTKDINGAFQLDLKYGKAYVGNTHDAVLQIYDGELEIGNTRQLNLASKYSEIEIGSTDNCKLDTYDDKVQLGLIKGELTLQDKYSEFEIGNFRSGRMDVYDSSFEMQFGESLLIKSKYTEFDVEKLDMLEFQSSYDDELNVGTLGDFKADMKYTNVEIGTLNGRTMVKAYDAELDVDAFGSDFAGLILDGKYIKAEMNLPDNLPYRLEAIMKYGDLEYDDSNFEPQVHIEKGDNLEIKAKVNGATDDSPLVLINGYDCQIDLN